MTDLTRELLARQTAYGLGVRLFLAEDGKITQREPEPGTPHITIDPAPGAKPSADTGPIDFSKYK